MNEWFRRLSIKASNLLGSPWMFIANVILLIIWLILGPLFNFSTNWQLFVNSATTIFTYLAVFLIQNTQNRDSTAIHLKLDELLKGVEGARTGLMGLQDLPDKELIDLKEEFDETKKNC